MEFFLFFFIIRKGNVLTSGIEMNVIYVTNDILGNNFFFALLMEMKQNIRRQF